MVEVDCRGVAESADGVWVNAYYVGVVEELFRGVVCYHFWGYKVAGAGET